MFVRVREYYVRRSYWSRSKHAPPNQNIASSIPKERAPTHLQFLERSAYPLSASWGIIKDPCNPSNITAIWYRGVQGEKLTGASYAEKHDPYWKIQYPYWYIYQSGATNSSGRTAVTYKYIPNNDNLICSLHI